MSELPQDLATRQSAQRRTLLWMLAAFLVSLLAAGSQLWPGSYIEYLEGGSPARLWGIIAAIAIAMPLVSGLGIPLCALAVGFGAPAAVVYRIVADTTHDPTSHNLFPFEIAIALVMGMAVAWAGAGIGGLLRYFVRRWRKSGP